MSAISFIDRAVAPTFTALVLACLPLAFVGLFVQGL